MSDKIDHQAWLACHIGNNTLQPRLNLHRYLAHKEQLLSESAGFEELGVGDQTANTK